MIVSRQPLANDLRNIIAGQRIAADLERIVNYAANIAKHLIDLRHDNLKEPVDSILCMARIAGHMLEDIIDSYLELNIEKAAEVWHCDDKIDTIFLKMIDKLRIVMSKNPNSVNTCTSLLFFARACERIEDHITNIAENVYYIVMGQIYRGESSK